MISLTAGVQAQVLQVDPSVQMRLTYTDNVGAEQASGQSDWVGQVTPGLGLSSTRDGGRVTGRMNVRMGGAFSTRDSSRSNASLGLQGAAQVVAVKERLFIDLDAAVRRNNLSLFAGRADDDFLVTDRRNETRTYSIAPRLEFRLGNVANGHLRYQSRWLDSGGASIGAQQLDRWDATLGNSTAFGRLGWGVSYVRSETGFGDGAIRDVTDETMRVTGSYRVSPQFQLRANVGYERNDFGGPRTRSSRITGAGFDWFPNPRTTLAGTVEDRFFGTGYAFNLTHRRARSNWLLSYERDVASSIRRFGSVFQDPFFLEFFNDPFYIAQFPDPIEREDEIRRLFGITGETFVSSAHYVDQRLRAAVSLIGVRNVVTLSAQRSDRSQLGVATGLRPGDEFSMADRLRTTSAAASWSHRLSGFSSVNASVTHLRAERAGASALTIRRWVAALGYSVRIGPNTVAGLTYRFQKARGATDFRENVLSANLGLRF